MASMNKFAGKRETKRKITADRAVLKVAFLSFSKSRGRDTLVTTAQSREIGDFGCPARKGRESGENPVLGRNRGVEQRGVWGRFGFFDVFEGAGSARVWREVSSALETDTPIHPKGK